jgi:asparagine synthetase B (glutamine-hydrolysing)
MFLMAHAIELCVPYLDHLLVECATRIPPLRKLARHANKPLLIEAVGAPLLAEVGKAKEKGFALSFRAWMRQHAAALGHHLGRGRSRSTGSTAAVARVSGWQAALVARLGAGHPGVSG